MPSPFPGMDPFIEGQVWQGFHVLWTAVTVESLVPALRPKYTVRPEERIYLEHTTADRHIQPDVLIATAAGMHGRSKGGAAVAEREGVEIRLPRPEQVRERFLTIRSRETLEVVTIIELLSPSNKRMGSDGLALYLTKRDEVLETPTNLVELDLLRGGYRLPSEDPLPAGDFYAIVSRGDRRPLAAVYPWTLRDRMPTVPIPTAPGDYDVILDLQQVFTTVYDRAGYDYSLDYSSPVAPPLDATDARWVDERLRQRR